MPETYKRGLVATLLYRAYRISSTYESLHDEVEKLKKIFSGNGYPMKFVDRCIFRFFNKLYEKKPLTPSEPKKEFVIILPFLGTTSLRIKNELQRTFKKIIPTCSLKIVFKTSRRLSSCFVFKDKFPKSLLSGVIYKFSCTKCNLSYIGCTKRYWEERLSEHTHISALTGKPLTGRQVFTPMQHQINCCKETKISRDNFSIVGFEKDPYLVQVKESLLIKSSRPQLNGNLTSVPLSLFA